MRCNHRRARYFQRIVESFVRDVRNIHHHAEAVEFAHDVLAEGGEAVVLGLVGGGIGPVGVQKMGQREVTHAQRSIGAEHGEVVINHVPAFHAHQDGDLAFAMRAVDIGGGGGHQQVFWIPLHDLMDGINQVERALDGFWSSVIAGSPDGHEHRVQAAFARARDIHVTGGIALGEIELLIEEKTLGCVSVKVNDNRALMQLRGLR